MDRGDYWLERAEEARIKCGELRARVEQLEIVVNEAFDFLGGCDGAAEIRSKLLAAIQGPTND